MPFLYFRDKKRNDDELDAILASPFGKHLYDDIDSNPGKYSKYGTDDKDFNTYTVLKNYIKNNKDAVYTENNKKQGKAYMNWE